MAKYTGLKYYDPKTGQPITMEQWLQQYHAEQEAEETPSGADLWASMQETEARAAEDRAKAIEEVKAGIAGTQTGADIEAWRSELAGATPGASAQEMADVEAMRKLVESYSATPTEGADTALWRSLVEKLAAEPETITEELAGQMYEQARVPIEAQTQQNLRDIQQSYYSRGVPGGAMMSASQQAQIGKAGSLGNVSFEIAKARAEKKKADELNAIAAAGGLATTTGEQARADAMAKISAASGLAELTTGMGQTAYQQLMQKIAGLGGLGTYTGTAGMEGAETLADIYGATIPKVAVAGTAKAKAGLT